MDNDKFIEIMKVYVETSKTFVQLSSVGLIIPLVLHNDLVKMFGKIDKFTQVEIIFIIISWIFLLLAIGSGALYQYVAVKFMEYTIDPASTYIPRPLKYLVEARGPGTAYGAMVVSFYAGAICIVVYTMSVLLR